MFSLQLIVQVRQGEKKMKSAGFAVILLDDEQTSDMTSSIRKKAFYDNRGNPTFSQEFGTSAELREWRDQRGIRNVDYSELSVL